MRLRCDSYYVLFLLAIGVFFIPYCFTYYGMSVIRGLYQTARVAVFLVVITMYIMRGRISKLSIATLFFCLVMAISTIINGGSMYALSGRIVLLLGIVLLIELGLSQKPKAFVEAFATVLTLLMLANLVSMIRNPDGYDGYKDVYFLRHANQLEPMYVCAVVTIALRNAYRDSALHKAQLVLVVIACTFMVFHVASGSNIIAWIPMVLYFVLPYAMKRTEVLNIRLYVLLYVGLFILVLVFEIQNMFSGILHGLLGKDTTLSGRTLLWDTAISMIRRRPMLGYGIAESTSVIPTASGRLLSAHNTVIQTILESGIASLLVLVHIVSLVMKKPYEYRRTAESQILSLGMFSIALVMFSEAIGFFDIFILFAFSCNMERLLYYKTT